MLSGGTTHDVSARHSAVQDHYRGLNSKFDKGLVYCTEVTASLVREQLGVDHSLLRPVPLGQPNDIDGATVTLLDANHCPGSAMVVFERPDHAPVLHTGDFRFHDG